MVPASDCFSSHEECERQSASRLDDRPGIAAFRSSLSPAAGSRRRPGQRPGARIVRSLTEGCAPHGPRAAMCAGRASPVSGSHYRRARGREDSANTQPALLRGREMPSPQLRWRAAARRWATSWLAPGGQASQRQPPQRRPSSEERGETSTRFRSTKVLKRPRTWICGGQARGTPARLGRRVTTRRLCVIILHAFRMSIDKTSSAKGKGGPKAALSVGVNDPSAALQALVRNGSHRLGLGVIRAARASRLTPETHNSSSLARSETSGNLAWRADAISACRGPQMQHNRFSQRNLRMDKRQPTRPGICQVCTHPDRASVYVQMSVQNHGPG